MVTPNIDALAAERAALHELPRHATVFTDARGAADRPQPPQRRHARSLELGAPAFPTCADRSRTTPPRWPRCCATRATRPSRSASGTCADGERVVGRSVRPVAAAARLRPLLRLPRRRDRPVRAGPHLRQPPRRAAQSVGRAATTSARTSSTTRSASSTTRSRCGPTAPSSCTSPSARRTPRTRRRRRTSSGTAAASTQGGTSARDKWFARQKEMGIVPAGTKLAPRNAGVEAVGRAPENQQAACGAPAGGLRGVPRPHRRADRPARRVPRRPSANSTTR